MTIKQILKLYKNDKLSSIELVSKCIENIKKYDMKEDGINAVITLNEEEALSKAKESDMRMARKEPTRSLEGIPIAIKDVFCTQGIRTTAASKILENYEAPYDATCVQRLKEAGAIIIAKVNCDEFAHGASGENSAFGPTKNPYDTRRVPGGSSSGSAAIVAYGGAIAALGTDTGGSIRCPASFTGLAGLKPTYGLISRYGLMSMCSSTDTVAPIAKNVEDIALITSVICGKDGKDSNTSSFQGKDFTRDFPKGLKGLKIGYVKQTIDKGIDEEIKKIFLQNLEDLNKLGARIDEVSIPLFAEPSVAVYYIITPSEISSNLARFDGIKFGMSEAEQNDLKEMYLKTRTNYLGSESKRRIMLGNFALSAGYYDEFYNKAQKVRRLMKEKSKVLFEKFDLLVTPTMPMRPFKIGEKSDPLSMYMTDINLSYPSLANLPAISINSGWVSNDGKAKAVIGKNENKLPVGIQFIAKWWDEETLLRAANGLELFYNTK